jgi:mRNA-degrading endonuclease RelE of RelBE toxin-antitoxin system
VSRYQVQFSPQAEIQHKAMPDRLRKRFDPELRRTLGSDPYGHGSTAVRGDRDRREATIAGVIVGYYVSGGVAVVTVVNILSL